MRLKKNLVRAVAGTLAVAIMTAMILTSCGDTATPPSSAVPGSSSDQPISSEVTSGSSSSGAASSEPEAPASSNSYTPIDSEATSSSVSSASSSESASSDSDTKDESAALKKVIVEDASFYSVWNGLENYYNYYYFKIRNPNLKKAAKSVPIKLALTTLSGSVLKSETIYVPNIAAEDETVISGYLITSVSPESVSYQVQEAEGCFVEQTISGTVRSLELEVSGTQRSRDALAATFSGNVTNKSSSKLSGVQVMLLFKKDGKTYGGGSWFVGTLEPGETKAFKMINWMELADYDSWQIVAVQG